MMTLTISRVLKTFNFVFAVLPLMAIVMMFMLLEEVSHSIGKETFRLAMLIHKGRDIAKEEELSPIEKAREAGLNVKGNKIIVNAQDPLQLEKMKGLGLIDDAEIIRIQKLIEEDHEKETNTGSAEVKQEDQ